MDSPSKIRTSAKLCLREVCDRAVIEYCEHCNPKGAEIPFDHILDRVTG